MELISWDVAIPLIAVAIPAGARGVAVLATSMVATFARKPERRLAARRALALLLGRRREEED
ncbi:hypothetical protein [Actinoplanes sp. NPDC023714]|uniref:hypothetical protein n=1 Tax=Actinoplanes sp. NPDC023714 TaxID=3154322 RepID=UPI0033D657A3